VPSCLAINADVNIRRGHPMSIDESVAYHEAQIKAAAQLGFPVARCQFPAGAAVLERLEPIAARLKVKLGIEIHAPATLESSEVLPYRDLYARLPSPWLGFVPDFGSTSRAIPPTVTNSFLNDGIAPDAIRLALRHWASDGTGEERMQAFAAAGAAAGIAEATIGRLMLMFMMFGRMQPEAWAEIMPQVVHIHGKFFDFDASGDELAVDHPRTLKVFLDAGYNGSMSSEYEGHHFSDEGGLDKIERHHALCRRIIDDYRPEA
jgi:sugar phosphate isomerase/epimerase